MFKKKIMNVAKLDLTSYSSEALRKIGRIINCAMIYLPENPNDEFMQAFSEIKLVNVANIIRIPSDKTICELNGFEVLANANPDNLYIVNGLAILASSLSDKPVQFIVNGCFFYNESVNVDLVSINGKAEQIKFDYEKTKIYQNEIEITADFIKNSPVGTTVICISKIRIAEDVTEQMLADKDFHLICNYQIYCKKDVYGYIAANSKVNYKIVTDEKEYQNWNVNSPLKKKRK